MRARVAASAALAATLAMLLAGCIAPNATLKPYDPSDGISTKVGDVSVLNALVLSEDGVSGSLVFSALNSSGDDVDLAVQYESLGAKKDLEFSLPAREVTDFGFGDAEQVFLVAIGTKPGGTMPIYFQYGDAQGRELQVPVLDGSLEQYSDLLPQTPTPTPTPTPTDLPVPDPSATPAS